MSPATRLRGSTGPVTIAAPFTGAKLADRAFSRLEDELPIALLPIRIETRFARSRRRDPDLLVRIYPDQVHQDGHEPELTAAEIEWGEHFWLADFRAGPNEGRRAGAWEQLASRLGPARAAWVARAMRPLNLSDRPQKEVEPEADPDPMPKPPSPKTRASEWTRAARGRLLPERFAVVGYRAGSRVFVEWTAARKDDAVTGPSPEHEVPAGDGPPVDEGMLWMTDFEAAEKIGLGVRVSARGLGQGLDLLAVFGVRTGQDPLDEAAALTALLEAHHYTDGLGLPSPGEPTNNTDSERTGFSGRRRAAPPAAWLAADPTKARPPAGSDGAALASALSLDPDLLIDVDGSDALTSAEARLLQAVLWPGGAGYALEQLLDGVTTPTQRGELRGHFEEFVRPAGPLPVVRAGPQPYGVLPVAPLETVAPQGASADLVAAVAVLTALRSIWETALPQIPRAGGPQPDRALLRVLGMEACSQAFAARPLLGPDYVRDLLALLDPADRPARESELLQFEADVTALLSGALGLGGSPRLARAVYSKASALLSAPVAQREELSDSEPLAKDYLTWFLKASFADVLAGQDSQARPFGDEQKPLLFHLVRASILSELAESARAILARATPPGPPELEPEYVRGAATETMLWRLRQPPPAGGAPTLGDALWPAGGGPAISAPHVGALRQAIERLAKLPSARLDRMTREALDAHGPRLDAWITSLATRRLSELRAARPEGLRVGAYGWVEDLRPAGRATALPAAAARPQTDPSGWIHAPSVPHASTAAILRSGHLSHAGTATGRALGIDLSSARVRDVDDVLDALRQGQSLGEVFGYRMERAMHDAAGVRLDQFVPALRSLCPLRAGRLLPAANGMPPLVVDGVTLLRRHRGEAQAIPWGTRGLPAKTSAEGHAVAAVLDGVATLADALSDAAVAESVHQATLGNMLRSGGSLDALDRGEAPPPALEVAHPWRSGIAVTHRVGVLRAAAGDPLAGHAGWAAGRPRTHAEPVLSRLCAELLPLPAEVLWQVRYDRTDGQQGSFWQTFSLADLDLAPLDVVYGSVPGRPGAAELEERAIDAARAAHPAFAGDITLVADRDPTWGADIWTLPQLETAAASIRALLANTRPLEAGDLVAVGSTPAPASRAGDLYTDRVGPLVSNLTQAIADLDSAAAAEDAGDIRDALLALSAYALPEAVPDSADAAEIAEQAERALETAREREKAATDALTGFDANAPGALELLVRVTQTVLDRTFVVAPPVDPSAGLTFSHSSDLCGGDDAAPDRWLARLARVRSDVALVQEAIACGYASAPLADRGAAGRLRVSQWPQPSGSAIEPWAALPAAGTPPAARTSLVFEGAGDVPLDDPVAGLLVDEWVEVVPTTHETTAVTFGYDAPGATAPQAILLGVAPRTTGGWTAEAVEATVLDARRLALLRVVDRDLVPDAGHVLPALFFAFNAPDNTISTKLSEAI